MKGVVGIVAIAIALIGLCGTVVANPPIVPPYSTSSFVKHIRYPDRVLSMSAHR